MSIGDIATERRRKGENQKRKARGMEPVPPKQLMAPPEFCNPAAFPDDTVPILRRRKLSKRQFSQFVENFPMFLAGYCSADVAIMLQTLIRLGDIEAIKVFLSTIGLTKSSPQMITNIQNNHVVNASVDRAGDRTIDTLVRQLDERDRKMQNAITVQAVKQITQ